VDNLLDFFAEALPARLAVREERFPYDERRALEETPKQFGKTGAVGRGLVES
jgi:hypothetical protein